MQIEKLVRRSIKGDNNSFAKLIKYYEKDLYRVAISYMKNDSDALDCIQDTILKAYEKISSLSKPEYFKTWLIKILINNCNTELMKKNRLVSIEGVETSTAYYDSNSKSEMFEILDELSEEYRNVVLLYYYQDLTIKEISDVLELKEGTVKSRLSRAREKIKTILINTGGVDSYGTY